MARLLAFLLALPIAWSGTITVTTNEDELGFIPNATCSLREAIVTVNDQHANGYGGCFAPGTLGSSDTLVLAEATYSLTRTGNVLVADQNRGNPNVLRSVEIVGQRARVTAIDGDALPRQGDGGVLNVGSISGSGADPGPSNNNDSVSTHVTEPPSADPFIALNGPASVAGGSAFELTAIPFNDGPSASTDVAFDVTLDATLEILSVPGFCSAASNVLTCGLRVVGHSAPSTATRFWRVHRSPKGRSRRPRRSRGVCPIRVSATTTPRAIASRSESSLCCSS